MDSPPVLYHYTSSQGLQGILQTGSLWATHTAYLNDSSEFEHAAYLLTELLTELKQHYETDLTHPIHSLADRAVVRLQELPGLYDRYVTCFCSIDNLLSQWRAYGHQGGYSIGFDHEGLIERLPPECQLAKVNYSNPHFLQGYFEEMIELMEMYGSPGERSELEHSLIENLGKLSATIKHPAFAEEHEWRIVCPRQRHSANPDLPGLRFRYGSDMVVPYLNLGIAQQIEDGQPTLPINSVTIGPMREPELARQSLLMLLESLGYHSGSIEVRKSDAPLRV